MRDLISRLGIWGELMVFLWRRKLYWLVPMLIVLALVAVLFILSNNPVTGPFIYSLW